MKRKLLTSLCVMIAVMTLASVASAQGGNLPPGSYRLALVNGVVHPSPSTAAKIKSLNASEPRGGLVGELMGHGVSIDLRADIGQMGAQFDRLAHIGIPVIMADDSTEYDYYNFLLEQGEWKRSHGAESLGTENGKPYSTLGVPFGIDWYKKSVDALAKQGISDTSINDGNPVLFNSTWSESWKDPETYTSSTEVWSSPSDLVVPTHQAWLMRDHISNIGNVVFGSTFADKFYDSENTFLPIHKGMFDFSVGR